MRLAIYLHAVGTWGTPVRSEPFSLFRGGEWGLLNPSSYWSLLRLHVGLPVAGQDRVRRGCMAQSFPCPSVSRVSTGTGVWEGRKHHQLWGRPATPTPGPWAAAEEALHWGSGRHFWRCRLQGEKCASGAGKTWRRFLANSVNPNTNWRIRWDHRMVFLWIWLKMVNISLFYFFVNWE